MADEVELSEIDYKLKYTGEEIDNILSCVKEFKTVYNKMKRVQAGCENISMTAAGMDVIRVIDFSIAFNGVPCHVFTYICFSFFIKYDGNVELFIKYFASFSFLQYSFAGQTGKRAPPGSPIHSKPPLKPPSQRKRKKKSWLTKPHDCSPKPPVTQRFTTTTMQFKRFCLFPGI